MIETWAVMSLLRVRKTNMLTSCGFREDPRGVTMFPEALKTISDCVHMAQMHMYLQETFCGGSALESVGPSCR